MADVTVTAGKVVPLGNAIVRRYDAGGAIGAGKAVYVANDGDVEHADANTLAPAQARGLVVSNGTGGQSFAAGERVDVVTHGPVAGFSGMTPGAALFVSADNAGGLTHTAPTANGDYPFAIGYAESDQVAFIQPQTTVPVVNAT